MTTLFVVVGCDLAKHVPSGKYLLHKNELIIPKEYSFKEDNLRSVIRQKSNYKTAGLKLKLIAFNLVDSTEVAKKRIRKNKKLQKKNEKRIARQERINERRIQRALNRGEEIYRSKEIKLKDTLNPRPFFREWLKYEYGEAPRIFDELTMDVSVNQLELYLNRKGFFNAKVRSEVDYDNEKQRVTVNYIFDPNKPSIIDSIYPVSGNPTILRQYEKFINENRSALKAPVQFDADKLSTMRDELSVYMRNQGIYGFRKSYVNFEIDTIGKKESINVAIQFSKRFIDSDSGESSEYKPFAITRIRNVVFHIADTNDYEGNFVHKELKPRGMSLNNLSTIPTFDTLRYDWYEGRNSQYRGATFYYNGKLKISPELIEFQNYLEENNIYRGNYTDQSFNRLIQLDLFQHIKPELIENDDNTIDVHYHLTPSKHQSFSFEPRGTNSNGFLGIASSVNYQHKNIFGGGERLKLTFSGGFESQPQIFDDDVNQSASAVAVSSFNTLEYGPVAELEIPGLFPASLTRLTKRQMPKTAVSIAYNFQRREEFNSKNVFQMNYLWKFYDVKRTQVFTLGLPLIGGAQYVQIDKSKTFEDRLNAQNDLFLLNAYSNQFIWKDLKMAYQFTNQEITTNNIVFSYSTVFDLAGNTATVFTTNQEVNDDGNKEIFGVRYSQFARMDNDLRLNHNLGNYRSINYRLQFGAGLPYGNNGLNLPFDYSFFSGGANDNRGFRARALGPGVYKYYLDTMRSATQIGDIRIGGSLEYRFKITGMFKGAVFSDAGNVWTYNEDENRLGGQFITSDWYKQIAIAGGVGLRVDLDFLIIRLDLGIPLRNPALPLNARWIFQSRQPYIDEGIEVFGEGNDLLPNPFMPQIHIAIGYPF